MKHVIEEGQLHITMLYEYKSVISSLIQVKGDSENKKDLYKQNLAILNPQVQKMRALYTFNDLLQETIVSYTSNLLQQSEPPTEEQLDTVAKVLNVALSLDYLKTWQAGLNNDFSMYRRAIQHVKKDYNMSEDESLRHFLINPNNINAGVKNALQSNCAGYEKVMLHLIRFCTDTFDLDNENHLMLRVAVFSVFLIDPLLAEADMVGKAKKVIKFSKIGKTFKNNPRITLYNQLPFNVANYLKGCPNFNNISENDSAGTGCSIL